MILEYFNKFFLPILLEIIYSLFIVELERFSYKKYTRIIIIALFFVFFFPPYLHIFSEVCINKVLLTET